MGQYDSSRELVVSTCHRLLERGYLKATEGNVSVRVPGRSLFAITPSNYDYGKMRADDICVLDFDLHRLSGTRKASIESGMHAAVYQERPDVNVVIHTHQPYASALALIDKPIPALFDEQVMFLGRGVAIVPYGPSGTTFLKRRVKSKLRQRRQRLHPGQPRRARAGRRRRARRAQHGPAREGGPRLPARAARRREGRPASRCPSARSPSPSCAPTRRSSPAKRPRRRHEVAAGRSPRARRAAGRGAGAPRRSRLRQRRRTAPRRRPRQRRRPRRPEGRGRPTRSPGRGHQQLPRRGGRCTPASSGSSPAAAQGQAGGHGAVPRLLRDQVRALQGAHRRGRRVHPRRRAAQPGLQSSRSRSPSRRPTAPTCGTPTATATSTSCRPAGPRCWAATTRRCATRSSSCCTSAGRSRACSTSTSSSWPSSSTASCPRSRCSACSARAPSR